MLITTLFQVRPEGHREPRNEVGFQSLTGRISGIQAGNFPILNIICHPTVSLSPKVHWNYLTIVLLVSFQEILGLFD